MSNHNTAWDIIYGYGEGEQSTPTGSTHKVPAPQRPQLGSQRGGNALYTERIQLPYATDEDASLTRSSYRMRSNGADPGGKGNPLGTASKHMIFDGFEHAFNDPSPTAKEVSESVVGGLVEASGEAAAGDRAGYVGLDVPRNFGGTPQHKRRKTGVNLPAQVVDNTNSDGFLGNDVTQRTEVDLSEGDVNEMTYLRHHSTGTRPTSRIDAVSNSQSSVRYSELEWSEEEYAEWLVRNNIQRCEAFIFTLQAVVDGCKKHGRTDTLELLARELEKVIDILNTPR